MRVIVFAKAPVPGSAKTRLIPALGAAGAARFHARLVERALGTACAASLGPVELCCAPNRSHPFFAECAARFGVALTDQGAGDLGERMHRALAAGLPAVLIGADCPAMTPDYLRQAADALSAGQDVALGPVGHATTPPAPPDDGTDSDDLAICAGGSGQAGVGTAAGMPADAPWPPCAAAHGSSFSSGGTTGGAVHSAGIGGGDGTCAAAAAAERPTGTLS